MVCGCVGVYVGYAGGCGGVSVVVCARGHGCGVGVMGCVVVWCGYGAWVWLSCTCVGCVRVWLCVCVYAQLYVRDG